jgi:hypothetical protein
MFFAHEAPGMSMLLLASLLLLKLLLLLALAVMFLVSLLQLLGQLLPMVLLLWTFLESQPLR